MMKYQEILFFPNTIRDFYKVKHHLDSNSSASLKLHKMDISMLLRLNNLYLEEDDIRKHLTGYISEQKKKVLYKLLFKPNSELEVMAFLKILSIRSRRQSPFKVTLNTYSDHVIYTKTNDIATITSEILRYIDISVFRSGSNMITSIENTDPVLLTKEIQQLYIKEVTKYQDKINTSLVTYGTKDNSYNNTIIYKTSDLSIVKSWDTYINSEKAVVDTNTPIGYRDLNDPKDWLFIKKAKNSTILRRSPKLSRVSITTFLFNNDEVNKKLIIPAHMNFTEFKAEFKNIIFVPKFAYPLLDLLYNKYLTSGERYRIKEVLLSTDTTMRFKYSIVSTLTKVHTRPPAFHHYKIPNPLDPLDMCMNEAAIHLTATIAEPKRPLSESKHGLYKEFTDFQVKSFVKRSRLYKQPCWEGYVFAVDGDSIHGDYDSTHVRVSGEYIFSGIRDDIYVPVDALKGVQDHPVSLFVVNGQFVSRITRGI